MKKSKDDLVEDLLSYKSEVKKPEVKKPLNLSETIIKTQDFTINGVEFFVGQRVRMKENFNRFKEHSLVEILGVNKQKEIHIVSVYDGSKGYVICEQLYFD
jgi:glycyl-tRNA synthetase (class II)